MLSWCSTCTPFSSFVSGKFFLLLIISFSPNALSLQMSWIFWLLSLFTLYLYFWIRALLLDASHKLLFQFWFLDLVGVFRLMHLLEMFWLCFFLYADFWMWLELK
jgi:hypothetical protein